MNEKQRKLLVDNVKATFETQKKKLEALIPEKPSLNNHILSALLTKSIVMHSNEEILESMHKKALNLGSDDLIQENSYYSRGKNKDRTYIEIDPHVLFIMPDSFNEELEKYKKIKSDVDQKIHHLEIQFKTIELKIQVGSAKHLEALIMQIDSLGSLDLISNQLLLGNATEDDIKKLNEGK